MITEPYASFLAIGFVSLIGAISPGPDFCIVLQNSLSHSRKAGLYAACGVSIGLLVHLSYTLVGLAVVIAESPFLYHCMTYIGVAYLFYIGLNNIIGSFKKSSSDADRFLKLENQISNFKSFSQGFLTNLLNPKAALFFISLFSQFINPNTTILVRVELALINWVITISWFLFLAYLVTTEKILGKMDHFKVYVNRVMGSVLISLGLKLLLT